MLNVLTLAEALDLLLQRFPIRMASESVSLDAALLRVLSDDIAAGEDLPAFTRSSVDGYALIAADTFGCSESMPAMLKTCGRVEMGMPAEMSVRAGECVYVPTGGAIPSGADAMVMLEYAEAFGEYMAIQKPAAPGQHLVLRGDDVKSGQNVLRAGRVLNARDIGSLAALGFDAVKVSAMPRTAVLSTGDEIVPVSDTPPMGRLRDVNGPMLAAAATAAGACAVYLGIVEDDETRLETAIRNAANAYDMVLLSGSSSAGDKDAAARIIARLGTLLFHGLALKPGKPTLAGDIGGVPVIGLPGHPAATYTVFHTLVRPLLLHMQGAQAADLTLTGRLTENLPSNHGREAIVPVSLIGDNCRPQISKSGLVTSLSGSCGYIRIPRDCEGLKRDEAVTITLWENA